MAMSVWTVTNAAANPQQSDYLNFLSQGTGNAQMGGIAGNVFNQMGSGMQGYQTGWGNSVTSTSSVAPNWTAPAIEPETVDANEPPHKHLQRRVNKWLKGVELPLH